MSKVKLGFLGVGFMGQLAHLANYAALDTCEVVALTDAKQKQAELVAKAYGVPKVYATAAEMLADPEIDAVVASQMFDNHVNIVEDVLNAGKHILTEKPLCLYPQNGKALVECAKKSGKMHMIANHKRSDPAVEYALKVIKKWQKTGEMGKMRYVRLTMPPGDWVAGAKGVNLPISTDEAYAAYTPEQMPAGFDKKFSDDYFVFVNYYIHQVNLMRYLMCEDYKLTFADKSGALLAVESKSGVSGIIEMAPYSSTDSWQESAMVCFEKGYVLITLPAPLVAQQAGTVTVFSNNEQEGVFTSPALANVSAMRNQAANFIKVINGEMMPPCDSAEGLKDLELAMDYIKFEK